MRFGIDRLGDLPSLVARLRGARLGVLGHAASVDADMVPIDLRLTALGAPPRLYLAPEHGFAAAAQDMAPVDHTHDAAGCRVVSLYGQRFEDLSPRPDDLGEIDVLVVDLCDVGARYYTFVWTALLALRACARAGVHVVVCDRPNPLGGVTWEGRSQQPGFLSFVGLEPLAMRHGLTVGEIVAFFAERDGLPVGPGGALSIVSLEGWERAVTAHEWDRPFVQPSPNMPTADTALVYPGGCLLEGTNLSEGRGHTRPFEVLGAPWLDGRRLAAALHEVRLPGFRARALEFVPMFHKHAGVVCGGIQIHVTDRRAFRPIATYAAAIALCHAQGSGQFRFRTERYEFVDDLPAFDLLTGSSETRLAIAAGEDARSLAERLGAADPTHAELHAHAILAARRAAWR